MATVSALGCSRRPATLSMGKKTRRLEARSMAAPGSRRTICVQCRSSSSVGMVAGPLSDFGVTAAVAAGAYALVQTFEILTRANIVEQKLSRKLVHITTGPLFLLCWPLFGPYPWSRYFASLVPLANGVRLLVLGLGLRQNEGIVRSMSRGGEPRELLRGPLFYVGFLLISTIFFWRESPVGMMALAMMCGGDGFADIVGRKFGTTKLPHNQAKSWAGSLAMLAAGFVLCLGFVHYFSAMGFFQLDLTPGNVLRIATVSVLATAVESLPITSSLDDNVVVPATVIIVGTLLFPGTP